MARDIDLHLPVLVYRVGGTAFLKDQVKEMIHRTNEKLYEQNTGIKIVWENDIEIVTEKSFAYVYYDQDVGYMNLRELLKNGADSGKLRIFLVKVDVSEHSGSWTYDPIDSVESDEYPNLWRGAIFITEQFNDNSDQRYKDMGYPESSDTLLHELGHVLMQDETHYSGDKYNFMHELPEYLDSTIFPSQVSRMRGDPKPRQRHTPYYLVPAPPTPPQP